jgi:hypothetical protein
MRCIGTPFRISLPRTSETSADRAKRAEALLRECQERVVAGHGGAMVEPGRTIMIDGRHPKGGKA